MRFDRCSAEGMRFADSANSLLKTSSHVKIKEQFAQQIDAILLDYGGQLVRAMLDKLPSQLPSQLRSNY